MSQPTEHGSNSVDITPQAARAARRTRRARAEAIRQRRRQVTVIAASVALAAGAVITIPLAVASPAQESPAVAAPGVPGTPDPAAPSADASSTPVEVAASMPSDADTYTDAGVAPDAVAVQDTPADLNPSTDAVARSKSSDAGVTAAEQATDDQAANDSPADSAGPSMAALRRQSAELPVASEGDSGRVVAIAQRALGVKPASGYFGPQTRKAVKQFQAGMGLPKTGKIATWTWAALGGDVVAKAEKATRKDSGFTPGKPAAKRSVEPPILEEGDSGEAVAVVQRALGVQPASGYFGPKTAEAVRDFQDSVGLPTTGTIATWTWKSLGAKVAKAAGQAHATSGTEFGPGAPASSDSGSSGSGSSGSGSSGSGSSGSGSSGSGSSGSGSSGSGSSGSGGSGTINVNGRFCPAASFSYGQGLGAPRPGGRTHAGLDLMGSRGTPIYAIDGGTVTRSGYQSNGSLILDITGPNGMFFYGHFDSILFSVGAKVKAGQVIGYMGDTGSPGAVHLHLEWRPNGWSGGPADVTPLVRQLCG